jgi:YHS domain-containing protein
MRHKILAFAALSIGALALSGCSTNQPSSTTSANLSQTAIPATDLKNTVCPVSGDKVGNSTDVVVYDGKVYHMCCDDCHKEFVKYPQK